jgi:hypothetical protein
VQLAPLHPVGAPSTVQLRVPILAPAGVGVTLQVTLAPEVTGLEQVTVIAVKATAVGFTVTTSVSLGPTLDETPTVKFCVAATVGAG